MQNFIIKEFGFRANRKKISEFDTSKNRKKIQLFRQHDDLSVNRIIFSDEKLSCTEQCYNPQNYVRYAIVFKDIPRNYCEMLSE